MLVDFPERKKKSTTGENTCTKITDEGLRPQLHVTGFVSERYQFKVYSSLVCSYNFSYLKLLFKVKFDVAPMHIRYHVTGALNS